MTSIPKQKGINTLLRCDLSINVSYQEHFELILVMCALNGYNAQWGLLHYKETQHPSPFRGREKTPKNNPFREQASRSHINPSNQKTAHANWKNAI